MSRRHLLIIGGTGFLGSHLARRSFENGYVCTLVGRRPVLPRGVEANLLDVQTFAGPAGERIIREACAIVYLASTLVPASSAGMPTQELFDEVKPAFENFLRIAKINSSVRIILVSSGGTVYGNTTWDPIPEEAPLEPISLYGMAKVVIESTLTFCSRTSRQPVAILRVSNPVGKYHRSRRQGLVPAIIRALADGQPLPVYGDGSQVRDYLDADDVADAILLAAGLSVGVTPVGVWNVGSGHGQSVREVIELVGSVVGRTPRIEWLPARPSDVKRVVLDISRARRELGWRPSTPLRRSIEKVVEASTALPNDQ